MLLLMAIERDIYQAAEDRRVAAEERAAAEEARLEAEGWRDRLKRLTGRIVALLKRQDLAPPIKVYVRELAQELREEVVPRDPSSIISPREAVIEPAASFDADNGPGF